jgi:hypothetical protein
MANENVDQNIDRILNKAVELVGEEELCKLSKLFHKLEEAGLDLESWLMDDFWQELTYHLEGDKP